ncbi:hypothetical protein DH2020_021890 [Rehmannia glutinosa]|uniref:Importin N-terminal domain-containing protein n=1 Tax=Rehmannia glutinosa TaxID=99300 RepID=A0ABR0WD62_REHGL
MDADSTQLQQAQLMAILGPDMAPFETLISHLMSSANEQRSQAESIFNLLKQNDPNSLALKLAHLLSSSVHLEARAMATILLRKQLTRDDSFIWPELNESTRSAVKSILLSAIQSEESKSVIKKLCDTVSSSPPRSSPTISGPRYCPSWETLIPFITDLHTVFLNVLNNSPNSDVKIAALSAVINFIQCLSSSNDRDRFQDLLPAMMRTLTEALNSGQEATAQEALELLIELAGTEPRFLRRQIVDVVGSMLQVAEAESLEEGTRHLAIEFVITLAEARDRAPGMMRKLPQFISRLFAILMKMLLDVDDDPAWHSAETKDEDAGETSNYSVGQECLDRLAIALGGNTIVPVASEQLPVYLSAAEWQKHHAALIALAQIAEGCSKVMIKNLEQVVNMVLNSFQHPHPRVRWAAINAIGQLSTDLGPDLQVQYHQRVLPALASAMDDFQNPRVQPVGFGVGSQLLPVFLHPYCLDFFFKDLVNRLAALNSCSCLPSHLEPLSHVVTLGLFIYGYALVLIEVQAHAASAVLNFSENCTPEILTPYLDGIVHKLLLLLQNSKQMVQEGALTALASVADSSQEHFQKYYGAVMPYLKTILVNATDKSNRMLRAKAMECISLVGMAVGKDTFKEDAKQVMEVLMSLQGSQMETDDPTTSYMLQAWARLCKCLGQDFLPYMSVVMPPLLQSAQLKPDVTITSADSDNEIDESDDERSPSFLYFHVSVLIVLSFLLLCDLMETITLGDKRIGIKTSVLEEKATACNMLCCYADELKEGFYPWIDQVGDGCPNIGSSFEIYFHEEVRKAAVSAMPELLRSAKLAVEKGIAQGRNETYVKQLSDYIVPALVEALHKEPDTEICANMLDALNECLQISGPLLDESQVRSIVDEIKQVGEILGTLIKTFKASFLPFFDELSSYLMPMWGKDKSAEERRIAICIFDDVAEQCRESALKYVTIPQQVLEFGSNYGISDAFLFMRARYYDTHLPFLLEACNDENPDVRQAAVYGLGVCAEFGGSVFKPLVGEALSRLNVVIRHPNALQPENVMAYDNAVSALGKICQFHRDSIDSAQVVPAWLGCLPIKGDLIEAKAVHDQLCSMVERSDSVLLGPNNQYLPKIVSVFAEVLCAGKDLATEQTASRMVNLLRHLQQTLPPSTLASTWSSLQPQQQLALQSILSS